MQKLEQKTWLVWAARIVIGASLTMLAAFSWWWG